MRFPSFFRGPKPESKPVAETIAEAESSTVGRSLEGIKPQPNTPDVLKWGEVMGRAYEMITNANVAGLSASTDSYPGSALTYEGEIYPSCELAVSYRHPKGGVFTKHCQVYWSGNETDEIFVILPGIGALRNSGLKGEEVPELIVDPSAPLQRIGIDQLIEHYQKHKQR